MACRMDSKMNRLSAVQPAMGADPQGYGIHTSALHPEKTFACADR
jgi:hypothetical protein